MRHVAHSTWPNEVADNVEARGQVRCSMRKTVNRQYEPVIAAGRTRAVPAARDLAAGIEGYPGDELGLRPCRDQTSWDCLA